MKLFVNHIGYNRKKDNLNKPGIYMIVNTQDGKCYVGSAKTFRMRFNSHRNALLKCNKPNSRLYNAVKKHGTDRFSVFVLEETNLDNLIQKEQFWIDTLKPEYNIAPLAGNCMGVKHTKEHNEKKRLVWLNRKHTEATKKLMSESAKGRPRSEKELKRIKIMNLGRKHTKEHILNCSGEKSSNAKLTTEIVLKIRKLADAGGSPTKIANKFNIHDSHVIRIRQRKAWKHLLN